MIQQTTKASCFIEYDGDTDQYLLYVNINFGHKSMIIEYSDITDEIEDLFVINESYNLYENLDDLLLDVEKAHFQRFLGSPRDNKKIDLLVNLRMKMRHQKGICDDGCILCNPDIGDDPFPDFTFTIRNMEPEGDA